MPARGIYDAVSGLICTLQFEEICLQVILLLQSSDRVSHDICESLPQLGNASQQGTASLILALRRWHKLSPDREFRCFVRGNELAGKVTNKSNMTDINAECLIRL